MDLGLVDASVVALAEELGVTRLATRDVRDLASYQRRSSVTSKRRAPLRDARAAPCPWATDGEGGVGPSAYCLGVN